jgi:tRNA uridine 5-carboxymethylaminomethyl modification enzyme
VSGERLRAVEARAARIDGEIARLRARRREGASLFQHLCRPETTYAALTAGDPEAIADAAVGRQVEIAVKYDGYIRRMRAEVGRFKATESVAIPDTLDYATVPGLSTEARQRLGEVRPRSLGQASRVPGITPATLSILAVWAHRLGPQPTSRRG